MAESIVHSAHGKFLITGEYVVLDYIPALAIPLRLNQYLQVSPRNDRIISWKSYDADQSLWFESEFSVDQISDDSNRFVEGSVLSKLFHLLNTAILLQPKSMEKLSQGCDVITTLDFNRKYGMGTSSTLVSLIAQWLECDPYALQFECFGGSGYDIACATASSPIIYQYHEVLPHVSPIKWSPATKENIFFVYLNRKQNSRKSIARFDRTVISPSIREELMSMPQQLIEASDNLNDFETIIKRHETIIGALIGLEPVQDKLFADYQGAIKSLGGWGGDFVLATGGENAQRYFINKGYDVIFDWDTVALNSSTVRE